MTERRKYISDRTLELIDSIVPFPSMSVDQKLKFLIANGTFERLRTESIINRSMSDLQHHYPFYTEVIENLRMTLCYLHWAVEKNGSYEMIPLLTKESEKLVQTAKEIFAEENRLQARRLTENLTK